MNPTLTAARGHPYVSQASSSASLQDTRPNPRPYDSYESFPINGLQEPVLPWMKSESRQSLGSRSSLDTTSLHIMKGQFPDPSAKKKQRWSKHKWWLLLSNTLVKKIFLREKKKADCFLKVILLWIGYIIISTFNFF
jgi:hypothetical protein